MRAEVEITRTFRNLGIEIPPRKCKYCDRWSVESVDHYMQGPQHDACIVNLQGVSSACCGHGVKEGYIKSARDDHFIKFGPGRTGEEIRAMASDYICKGVLPSWAHIRTY